MKFDLSNHPHFVRRVDGVTGAVSFLLNERVAPFQRGLYYATPSISADGRWLWFRAVWPPSRGGHLAAVCLDAAQPRLVALPVTIGGGQPLLLPEGDAAYVAIGDGIYRVTLDGRAEPVLRMPAEIIANRRLAHLAGDLTLSADGRYLLLESQIGNCWLISLGELATGRVLPLRSFFRCYHHAVFSPTDPELLLLCQGPWHDEISGEKGNIDIRIWLMDTRQTRFEPLFGDLWFNHNCMSCHEWWTADGKVQWVDYDDGIHEADAYESPRRRSLIWPHRDLCHGQCDRSLRYIVADENPYGRCADRPCRILLLDRRSGRETALCSDAGLPPIADPADWRSYHLDPHPHFSPDGQAVVYTTCQRGMVDVAVAPVEQEATDAE